jgi:UDP-N-acetylglucosamine:LPS N-acetylglucosamine transferase
MFYSSNDFGRGASPSDMDSFVQFMMMLNGFSSEEKKPNYVNEVNLHKFEDCIARQLSDPEKAAVLARVYDRHLPNLKSVWPLLGTEGFGRWLSDEALYLGCPTMSHMNFFHRSFPVEQQRALELRHNTSEVKEALDAFFSDLVTEWKVKNPVPPVIEGAKKVAVVMYRTCGNGHLSLAQGLRDYLEQKKGCIVHLIDGGESEHLSRQRIPGYCTPEKGRDVEMQHLRSRIRQLHPDMLFNCVAHHEPWKQPGYDLGIPTAIIHSDYEVDRAYRTTHLHPRIPVVEEECGLVRYGLPDIDPLDDTLRELQSCTSKARSDLLIRGVGFPIRPAFKREGNVEEIQKIRKNLGLKEDERMIFVMAHRDEEYAEAKKMIAEIAKTHRDFSNPLCIVAVCGDDLSRQADLKAEIHKNPINYGVRLITKPRLSEQEMADHMKAISRIGPQPGMMMSPTGGSTTAEIAEMGVFVIRMPIRIGKEQANASYLLRHDLCDDLRSTSVVNKVSQALKWRGRPDEVYGPSIKWEEQLSDLYDEMTSSD